MTKSNCDDEDWRPRLVRLASSSTMIRLKILIKIDCNDEDWENPTQLFIKYWDQDCDDEEDWEWESQASSTQLKPGWPALASSTIPNDS